MPFSQEFIRCLYNKQNITCPLVDMNFILSCSTRYLTRSLRSLVRYRVEHSKIKFISTRGHVISSIDPPRYSKTRWRTISHLTHAQVQEEQETFGPLVLTLVLWLLCAYGLMLVPIFLCLCLCRSENQAFK